MRPAIEALFTGLPNFPLVFALVGKFRGRRAGILSVGVYAFVTRYRDGVSEPAW
jgi:hypothetical protein